MDRVTVPVVLRLIRPVAVLLTKRGTKKMTNADYIRSKMTDADIAVMIANYDTKIRTALSKKANAAWERWALSVTTNKGNMADRPGHDNPSIWYWTNWWCCPDNEWKTRGRTHNVSAQVWLSMQYKPEEWIEEEDE